MKKQMFRKVMGIVLALAMLASLFTCMMSVPASAAGTTPDLVEYKGTDYTCMKYTKGWSTIKAGNYRFMMDCKITSGVPCIQVGADEVGTALSAQSNYTETYDSVNYKYIITFTMDSDWGGNLGVLVGNYGTGNRKGDTTGDAVFACANPTLYKLDGQGDPTGDNLINTFASDYYSSSRSGNKWNRRNFASSTATCSTLPATYFDPDGAQMFKFKSKTDYPVVEYLSTTEFVKGDSYTFTCRFLTDYSGYTYSLSDLKNVFIIWASDSTGSGTRPVWANMPNFSMSYDATTATVTAHFTAGDDSVNNRTMTPGTNDYIQFRFGDRNGAYRVNNWFYFADFSLVNDNDGVNIFAPINGNNTTKGAASSNTNKWSTADAGICCARMAKGETFPAPVIEEEELPDYTDVTAKVAYFTKGNTGTLRYYNTERTLAAGAYELGFDWKVLKGEGSYLKLIVGGDVISEGNVGINNDGEGDDEYNTTNYTRKLYFELEDDATGIEIVIGNSDRYTSALVSGGYLKVWDGDAVTGGNKIHNIGDANYTSYLNGTTANKWQPWAASTKYVTLRDTVSGLFTAAGPAARRFTFKSNQDWCVAQYEDYSPTLAAGTYKLVIDCRQFTSTLLNVAVFLDTVAVSGATREYDDNNRKMYYTFTVSAAPSDSLKIRIGNYGNGGATASVGHVYLYATEGGEITGDSLIADTNAFTLDWTTSTTEYSQIWNTRGYNSNLIYYGEMPENYFATNNTATQMGHFTAGSDSYQVLAYKDPDYYLAAGTYRLTVDINNLGTAEPTVQLRYGTEIESSYSGTLIGTDGFTRTYEFTVSDAAHGVGVFIGNYGKGTDLDFYFKNPTLYKYENGAAVGYNIFEPLCTRTYDRHNWTGSRANALNARWTPINCNSDLFEINNVNADAFPGAVVTTGTPKMANFYYGANWNVFIYNDAAVSLLKDQTYVFTANVKSTGGTAPTIYLYDSYAGGNLNLNSAAYTSAYTDVTSGNTRTITFTMAKTVSVLRIRIGNYSDATDVIASIANVKLVKQGTDTNLITDLTTDTIQTTEGNRKWWIQGASSGYQNAKEAATIPAGYFEGTAQANMYYISRVTTAYTGLEYAAKVKPDTTYTLEFDWKSYGGAYPKIGVSTYDGSAWSGATQTALPGNTADGAAIGLLTGPTRPAVLGTYGHYAVSFTTPSNLYENGWSNLNLLFANYIKDDDFTHYARGSVYYGNFVLKESGTSVNIILNGDLAIAKTGNVSDADNATNFGRFVISIGKNNGSRDMYEELRILPQPANFFTANGPAAEKVMKFIGGDFDYIDQGLMLKSNTAYRLTYKASYINGLGTHVVENFALNGETSSETGFPLSEVAPITTLATSFNKANATMTYDFRTAADLRDYFTNANVRFTIPRNGTDIQFYVGDVKLYELSGNSTVGPNLINNGGFNFGDAASITNVATAKYGKDGGTYMPNVQFTGWNVSGDFEQNTSIDFATMTANSFPQALGFSERLVNLMQVLLGQVAATASNPYEDVNNDNKVNILDLIRTKKNAADASGEGNSAVDTQEAEFKATYVNGNNATNLSALSSANMLATAVTGNTYYISSSTGSDSNNGTSPSTPWKTLAKANSVTASGSAVLFKCGDTWRQAKTNASALICQNGVTYGSYGSGAKPVIMGSIYNYATRSWSNQGGNIWRTSIKNTDSSSHSYDDVGIIVFDGVIGTMKDYKAELSQNGDFWCHTYNEEEKGDGYVYVYADANPASKWADIEMGQKRAIIDVSGNNVTINNICVKYGGSIGMEGSGEVNVAISNCEVAYIGGTFNNQVRYGNGIQFGQGGSNLRIKNCYVHDVFDSCITFQSWSATVYNWSSVNFSNNLLTDSFMGIEWFAQETSTVNGIYLTNNIIRNMGGWSYHQRLGNPEQIGTWVCSCLKVSRGIYYANLSDFYIYDNTFDRSNGALVMWWWNDIDTAEEDRLEQTGLHIYHNNFYQDNAADRDGRLMNFKNEGGYYGASTAALQVAVNSFDTDPGTVKYIIHDDRVIYQ